MLTHGEDVEVHALKQRGWTISAIARHLGRDRKTIRAYINGTRAPGVRLSSRLDPLEPFARYSGRTFEAYRHDLRTYFQWAADAGLEVFSATRGHIEL